MNPRHTRQNLTYETHESTPPTHTRYLNYLADSAETYYALRKILRAKKSYEAPGDLRVEYVQKRSD